MTKNKELRKQRKMEMKQTKKKIKNNFKHRKGTFSWEEVEKVLKS